MAKFDTKWLCARVPAAFVVLLLVGCSATKCNDQVASVKESTDVQNNACVCKVCELKDSIKVLNLKNQELNVALEKCEKSKKKTVKSKVATADSVNWKNTVAKESDKPVIKNNYVPSCPVCPIKRDVANVPVVADSVVNSKASVVLDASCNNGVVVIDNDPTETVIKFSNGSVNNGSVVVGGSAKGNVKSKNAKVEIDASCNNGNVVVDNAPTNVDVSLGTNSVNNGAIVVGDENTICTVTPDTIVRFMKTEETIVKCRVVTKQRLYK